MDKFTYKQFIKKYNGFLTPNLIDDINKMVRTEKIMSLKSIKSLIKENENILDDKTLLNIVRSELDYLE